MAFDRKKVDDLRARASRVPFVTLVEELEKLVGNGKELRFRHDPSLAFHASDVASVRVDDSRVEVTTTFLGATGAVSPLATHFTEEVLRAESQDDGALTALYDLFHHRLIALAYRALQRGAAKRDPGLRSRALAATGLEPSDATAPVSPVAMLGRARLLTRRAHGKEALAAALDLAFPTLLVRVDDLAPRRVRLADEQRMSLGRHNRRLGRDSRLGRHIARQGGLVTLRIGPVDRAAFDSLMPGAPEHARLCRVVERVSGAPIDADLEIEIMPGEEPRAALGQTRLGRAALVRRPDNLESTVRPPPLRVRVPLTTDGIVSACPPRL